MPSVSLARLQYLECAGDVPGSVYIAPGVVIAVVYNGALLTRNVRYSESAGVIILKFTTEEGDRIDALCLAS